MNVEDTSSKAMVANDGAGFNWSYMADDEAPTNMAFMAIFRLRDSKIAVLKNKLEKISKEKDDLDNKIKKFENASQNLDNLIGSQISDKSKRGLGYVSYNVVPPPHTKRFSPLIIDWSYTGLPEFVELSVESYRVKPIKVARCKYHQRDRMVNETNHSRVNHTANTVLKAVLTKTGLKLVNTVRHVNPKSTRRSFQRKTSYNNKNFSQKVNTAKGIVNTARPNSAILNAVRENKGKAVKASACWVWRPIKLDSALIVLKKHTYIDARGRSKSNRVLVVKPHLKKPYELLESINSKAFIVYNSKTMKVEENLHINFLENKPIITGYRPKWLFNIDALTESMNYVPVIADSDGDNKDNDGSCIESEIDNQARPFAKNNTKDVNTARPSINTVSSNINTASPM
nr:hypothetical protein [Tanacetum cinerariifolium]